MRRLTLALVMASGCAAATSGGGAHVAVYNAPLDGPASAHGMPSGCRLISAGGPIAMTELEMTGQKDPYRAERAAAAAAGANLLLVRTRMTVDRRTYDCPSTSPITDCPPNSGAWYRVVFERYACTDQAISALPKSSSSL